MSNKSVNVGVVGCGFISQNTHIPALLKCRDAHLAAVCDMNGEAARQAAGKFGIKKSYNDLGEMLRSERLDAVDVCTSVGTHATVAAQALEAGCHVLIEKPMTHSVEEADRLVTLSKAKNLQVCVIHNMLFLPPMMKMKSIVAKGEIGDVIRVEIRHGSPPRDYPAIADPTHWWHKLPGGCLGDVMPHPIYLARQFIGNVEPVAIYTNKLGHVAHFPIDEAQIVLRGERGLGTIMLSLNWPSLWHIDVYGTEKSVHGDLNNSYVTVRGGRTNMGRPFAASVARENLSRSLQILSGSVSTAFKMASGGHRGHFVQIAKFIESVRNGSEPPVTAEDGREVVRLWERITGQMAATLSEKRLDS